MTGNADKEVSVRIGHWSSHPKGWNLLPGVMDAWENKVLYLKGGIRNPGNSVNIWKNFIKSVRM